MNTPTIFITDCDHENIAIETTIFEEAGFPFVLCACKTEQDVIENCSSATALLNQYAPLNRTVFEALPSLQFIVRYGVGVDNINLADASEFGIQVCNVPDYGMNEVADQAFAMMLALIRKLPVTNKAVHRGVWDYRQAMPIHRFSDLTVGILGLGRIGNAFAKRLVPFGCRIIAHEKRDSADGFAFPVGIESVSFQQLLEQSDVLSVHCSLDTRTHQLFNEAAFRLMKPSAYFINVSRGGIVAEKGLQKALEEKWIAGAGLDVLTQEPMPQNHFIQKYENVILSPHIAWYSEESALELKRKCAEEAVLFLQKKPIRYPVNTPEYRGDFMKAIVYLAPNCLQVKDVPLPTVPDGWVLVKVSYAGICGTDLNIYAGTHPRAKAPLVLGHEFSGVIAKDAPGFKKGTRVTAHPLLSCGECSACQSGNSHVCNQLGLLGIDTNGAMAEYLAVPHDNIILLPDDVSDELGAFIEPVAVAVHTLRESHFRFGDNAIIFGCGTIGMVHALTLRLAGASTIVMVETDIKRAQLAREMGFVVANPQKEDLPSLISSLTNGDGFEWVLDCAGVQPVATALLDAVKVKGKIVVVAAYKEPPALPLIKGMFKEAEIRFVRVYRKEDFAIASTCISKDENYQKVITHTLPLEQAQQGFDLLTTQDTGAVKVIFQG